MEIVNLIRRDRRSLEESQSYVAEGPVLCRAPGPVFTLHDAVVRSWSAKGDPISLVVGAHAGESAAPGDASFEVINVRRLQVWPSRLIVAAVLIQPGNWVGLGATICRHRLLADLLRGSPRRCEERRSSRGDGFQEVSSIADWA